MNLPKIKLTFKNPINGYWDGGEKTGGIFEPQVRFENDPAKSFVKWGSWELNHWFNFPLHYERGVHKDQPCSEQFVVNRAKRQLRNTFRRDCTVVTVV